MQIDCRDRDADDLLRSDYYTIPNFQRPYSWERQHLEDFWDDVIGAPTAKDAFNDIRADLAAMQPRDARALEVVSSLVAKLDNFFAANDADWTTQTELDTLCQNQEIALLAVRDELATARQYINEMKG